MAAAQLPSLLRLLSVVAQKEAPSPLVLSQSCHWRFEVPAFHDIYEISVVHFREISVALQEWITAKIIKRQAIACENFFNGLRPRLSATRRGKTPCLVRDDGRLDLAGQRAFGAAPPRVNTALCLCSQSLPRERKYLKPEPSA